MPPRDPEERPMGDDRELDDADLAALRGDGPAGADPQLARLGEIARSLSADDLALDEPPPGVWEAIAARTGVSPAAPADPGARADADPGSPGVGPADGPPVDPGALRAGPADETSVDPGSLRAGPADGMPGDGSPRAGAGPLRPIEGGRRDAPGASSPPRRGRAVGNRPPRGWILAAAAAVLVVVVGVGALAARRDDGGGASVVASADLEPLPDEPTGAAVPARADLVDDGGRLELELATGDLPAIDGHYEVWLIDPDVEGMVSLGPVRADGRYAVPPDLDPGLFPIVDVSIEPADGDPTHSGVSLIRGTLA